MEQIILTLDQLQAIVEAVNTEDGFLSHTGDPVVNWAVDCLQLEEYIEYDPALYEAEVQAFAELG